MNNKNIYNLMKNYFSVSQSVQQRVWQNCGPRYYIQLLKWLDICKKRCAYKEKLVILQQFI